MTHVTRHLSMDSRPSVSEPVAKSSAQPDRVQHIWSQLSGADRNVILGHSEDMLSSEDRQRFVRIMGAVAADRRGKR